MNDYLAIRTDILNNDKEFVGSQNLIKIYRHWKSQLGGDENLL